MTILLLWAKKDNPLNVAEIIDYTHIMGEIINKPLIMGEII